MAHQETQKTVQEIVQRLSLRQPQQDSLKILDNVMHLLLPQENASVTKLKHADIDAQLQAIQSVYPHVRSFEHDFPSLCFALATGVGKTRLMGAFITLLHKAYAVNNFLVVAHNLTIYDKLKTDFTAGTPKYVFKGIDVFNQNTPLLVTGENYGSGIGARDDWYAKVKINIFNIGKMNELGGKNDHLEASDERRRLARFRRNNENIGGSYFDYLANCQDLVIIMDEAHRYRAEEGAKTINDLKPILGIELTATPQITGRGQRSISFQNIIYRYDLSAAMRDGYVKEPAVGTRKDFRLANYPDRTALEHLKLADGIFFHEDTKLALANFAQNNNLPVVKPFMLVVAEDKQHADELEEYLTSQEFKNGAYVGKVVKIYSGMGTEKEKEMIGQLLEIEKPGNPVEIVIHVNKLGEGWDVTNLYTIVPLRAANAPNLVEQSIGRGLRLPYGKRVTLPGSKEISPVDRLIVVSHEHYAEIIQRAQDGKTDNPIKQVIEIGGSDCPEAGKKAETLTPAIDGLQSVGEPLTEVGTQHVTYIPQNARELVGNADADTFTALAAVKSAMNELVQTSTGCDPDKKETVEKIVERVNEALVQTGNKPISATSIQNAIDVTRALSIDIPRIELKLRNAEKCGYVDFNLDCSQIPTKTFGDVRKVTTFGSSSKTTFYKEDAIEQVASLVGLKADIVTALRNNSDIDYQQDTAALIHKLVDQVVKHLEREVTGGEVGKILRNEQAKIVDQLHRQLLQHAKYEGGVYEVVVKPGYFALSQSSVAIDVDEVPRDFRKSVPDGEKSKIKSMVFTGFSKCLYEKMKFDSDEERGFADVLENADEVVKWFKPALTSFRMSWRGENGQGGMYSPDFIVETQDGKYICEVKADNRLNDPEVLAKKDAAVLWCKRASEALPKEAKHWHYLLIPHSQVSPALDFDVAVDKFEQL